MSRVRLQNRRRFRRAARRLGCAACVSETGGCAVVVGRLCQAPTLKEGVWHKRPTFVKNVCWTLQRCFLQLRRSETEYRCRFAWCYFHRRGGGKTSRMVLTALSRQLPNSALRSPAR